MSSNESKWTKISSTKIGVNEPKRAQMSLNKSKGAQISLNKL